jgi:hypothetical protein
MTIAQMQDIARARIFRVAANVEQYRRTHGHPPDALDDLPDDFTIPLDPFDGQPLRYQRLEHGYLIYSVFRDGIDQGGVTWNPYKPAHGDLPFRVERPPVSASQDAPIDAGPAGER